MCSPQKAKMSENLTEQQLADYKIAFSHFDKNDDGFISTDELRQVIEELGHTATDAELNAMIQEMDDDNSGAIDFAEFLALMARRLMLSDNEEEILEAFRVFDKDGTLVVNEDKKYLFVSLVVLSKNQRD